MANVTHIRQVGNLRLAGYDDGSQAFIYPTTSNLWVRGLRGQPGEPPKITYERELIAHPSQWGGGVVDWAVVFDTRIVIGVRMGDYDSPTITDIYHSNDSGKTWFRSVVPPNRPRITKPKLTGRNLYVLGLRGAEPNAPLSDLDSLVSLDGGLTFLNVNIPPPGGAYPHAIDFSHAQGERFLCTSLGGSGYPQVRVSDDGINFGVPITIMPDLVSTGTLRADLYKAASGELVLGEVGLEYVSGSGSSEIYDLYHPVYSDDAGETWKRGAYYGRGGRAQTNIEYLQETGLGGGLFDLDGVVALRPYAFSSAQPGVMGLYLGQGQLAPIDRRTFNMRWGTNPKIFRSSTRYFYVEGSSSNISSKIWMTRALDSPWDDEVMAGTMISAATDYFGDFTYFESTGYYRLVEIVA